MSEPTLNSPISFDPVVSTLPDGVLLPPEQGGEVVALLVDPGIGLAGWPLRVARAIARGWTGRGRTVVLVDAHTQAPSLHQLLNAENREGLTDAIEYGASADRVTQELSDEPFAFVSAGTVLSDQPGFWRSRRWGALLDSLRSENRVVLLYLPAGNPEIGAVVRQSDRAFWLGRAESPDAASFGNVRAIVPPAGAEGAARASDPSIEAAGVRLDTPRGLSGADQSSLAEKPEVEAERRMARAEDTRAPSGAAAGRPPTTSTRQKQQGGARPVGKRRMMPWLLLGLLLVLAGAVIAHWFGIFTIPGLPVRMEAASTAIRSFPLGLRVAG